MCFSWPVLGMWWQSCCFLACFASATKNDFREILSVFMCYMQYDDQKMYKKKTQVLARLSQLNIWYVVLKILSWSGDLVLNLYCSTLHKIFTNYQLYNNHDVCTKIKLFCAECVVY